MGRKAKTKKQPKAQTPARKNQPTVQDEPAIDPAVTWVLGLPRVMRIILIVIPALATTIIFTQVVNMIYLRFFYSPATTDLTWIIPSGLALLVYLIGWVLVVGTRGEKPQEREAVKWYLIASIILILFAFLWVMYLVFENMRFASL